jgi:hypothetical protein
LSAANQNALLTQAAFITGPCGNPLQPKAQNYVDIPSAMSYVRFVADPSGISDVSGFAHSGKVPFMLRAISAQALPRNPLGISWRLRYGNGRYFQSSLAPHACAFGLGSNRQVYDPEVEWLPGDKVYIDLLNFAAAGAPSNGYNVTLVFEGSYRFPVSGKTPAPASDMSRYFVNTAQNILAPEWMTGPGCPTEIPPGYQDEHWWYKTPTADLPITGQPVNNVKMQIDPDYDYFITRELWGFTPFTATNQGTGLIYFRARRGDGYTIASTFVPINAVQGPIFPELKIKANDTLSWDAYVVNGAGSPGNVITFGLYLGGVRRRKAVG